MKELIADNVKVQMCVTSPPYRGLRDYGVDGQWHSTRDIQNNAYVCAAGECASELRSPKNNIPVECKFIDGNYHYRLEKLEYARQRYRLIKDGAEEKAEESKESDVCIPHPAPISLMPLTSLEMFSEGRLF